MQPAAFDIDASDEKWAYQLFVFGPEFWADGSSVFAGRFCGTLLVAPQDENATEIVSDPPECAELNTPVTDDGIITRYRPDGSLDWLLTPLSPGNVGFFDVHATAQGRIVAAGYASEAFELIDTHGTAELVDGPTMFIAAFEGDGQLAWRRSIETIYAPSIATTADGGVVAVGALVDPLVIEPGTDQEETLEGPGVYAIRYDGSGELRWAAMLLAGETFFMPNPLVSVGNDAFAVAGTFGHEAVLAPGGPDEMMLEAEFADYFVALFELE